ncbi:MAG TPA: hypothetical protein VKT30_06545 [Caulobacteraceae bacterium]|nr:hypothetical protein [Caulobacteraceae bacterium]
MKDQIDCRCQSGEYLRFALFKEGRPLSPMAGNYMYVREEGDALSVVYLGETDNLAQGAQDRWAEAEAEFGASGIYTRLNITAAARRRELTELLRAYTPPMNMADLRDMREAV